MPSKADTAVARTIRIDTGKNTLVCIENYIRQY
jgi:hypothetical protein